jgi:nicotinate-nucleotide adenylyltransferase
MRVGILGGTFDPVHLGHLLLAEQAREAGRLAQVRFVVSARPPHKLGQALTPFAQRVEMLRLAVAGEPAFQVDEREEARPGPGYTVDTLEELHREMPEATLVLVVGADCLTDLPGWRQPERIAALAEVLVMGRAAAGKTAHGLPSRLRLTWIEDAPEIGIASSDLRERAREGHSLRYLVPRAVECYIQQHGLYGEKRARGDRPHQPEA